MSSTSKKHVVFCVADEDVQLGFRVKGRVKVCDESPKLQEIEEQRMIFHQSEFLLARVLGDHRCRLLVIHWMTREDDLLESLITITKVGLKDTLDRAA